MCHWLNNSVFQSCFLQSMELLILSKLKWDLTAITSYDYLDFMINTVSTTSSTSTLISEGNQVRKNTEKLVTLCATDETFMSMPPSLVAASALVTAIEQDDSNQHINLNEIVACIRNSTNLQIVRVSSIERKPSKIQHILFSRLNWRIACIWLTEHFCKMRISTLRIKALLLLQLPQVITQTTEEQDVDHQPLKIRKEILKKQHQQRFLAWLPCMLRDLKGWPTLHFDEIRAYKSWVSQKNIKSKYHSFRSSEP